MKSLKISLLVGFFVFSGFISVLAFSDNTAKFRTEMFFDDLRQETARLGFLTYMKGVASNSCQDLKSAGQNQAEREGLTTGFGKTADRQIARAFDDFMFKCCEIGRRDRGTKTLKEIEEGSATPEIAKKAVDFLEILMVIRFRAEENNGEEE